MTHTHEQPIITSDDVPKLGAHNLDPTKAEFERLEKGQLLVIDTEAEAPLSGVYGNATLMAELKIGHLSNEPQGALIHELMVVRVANINDPAYRRLASWASAREIPQSGIVVLALSGLSRDQLVIEAAAFVSPYTNNVLGREGTLQWEHHGLGQLPLPQESPYRADNTISGHQVRLGIFGNNLLLEGLSDNSDTEVRTVLPHGSVSPSY